jgi:HTH-type transcriptional regulator/antitoxin MqsA
MEFGTRMLEYKYKEFSRTIEVPGLYCTKCNDGVHTVKDLKVVDRLLNEFKAREENLLLPDEIRRIRKKLHLTQEVAGLIIGGGPRAFQKYESGDLLPSRAISSALRLLEADPQAIEILKSKVQGTGREQEKKKGRKQELATA